ncbi:hypothetical protein GCM10007216_28180 [Thalassobacillus devorans]|uniref:Secreted protein n=1 Tax=Thalassobacillus devorans TaxID=279813 RepID=A0ABQ1PEQ3_9BACI|nr:hypothetical protein [Thalassobacillus devorans]NIK29323.1 hypothetical protein [Thalassobacillus devorans]GGC95787.1 hypothetical protein GCM10007216_28180 [Thalassobacillus devorans]
MKNTKALERKATVLQTVSLLLAVLAIVLKAIGEGNGLLFIVTVVLAIVVAAWWSYTKYKMIKPGQRK